jgi:hypothetical protein
VSEQQFYGMFALLLGAIGLLAWFDGWSSGVTNIDEFGAHFIEEGKDTEDFNEALRFPLFFGLGCCGYGMLAVNGVF